jgi:hypothetical protein
MHSDCQTFFIRIYFNTRGTNERKSAVMMILRVCNPLLKSRDLALCKDCFLPALDNSLHLPIRTARLPHAPNKAPPFPAPYLPSPGSVSSPPWARSHFLCKSQSKLSGGRSTAFQKNRNPAILALLKLRYNKDKGTFSKAMP